MLIDSHCHLHLPDLAGKHAEIFAEMAKNGVGGAICVGVTIEDFPSILALIERHPNLLATVGVHPENTDVQEAFLPALCELAQHRRNRPGLLLAQGSPGMAARTFPDAYPRRA